MAQAPLRVRRTARTWRGNVARGARPPGTAAFDRRGSARHLPPLPQVHVSSPTPTLSSMRCNRALGTSLRGRASRAGARCPLVRTLVADADVHAHATHGLAWREDRGLPTPNSTSRSPAVVDRARPRPCPRSGESPRHPHQRFEREALRVELRVALDLDALPPRSCVRAQPRLPLTWRCAAAAPHLKFDAHLVAVGGLTWSSPTGR